MKKFIALIAFVMVGVLAFGQNKKGPEIPYPNVPIDESYQRNKLFHFCFLL